MARDLLSIARRFGAVLATGIGVGIGVLAQPIAVSAHPHIFIDATLDIHFAPDGSIERFEHGWTFDPYFSAWTVQGLDADGDGITSREELQPLADENMVGLSQFGFYTYAGPGEDAEPMRAVGDQHMEFTDGQVTLAFSVAPEASAPVAGRYEIAVNDPEYYVAITIDEPGDVRLHGAPAGCAVDLVPPEPMSRQVEERLYALGPEVLELPPDLAAAMRGTQGLVVLRCPGGVAETALEAIDLATASRPAAPFGGPPPEVGIPMPRDGALGWLQDQQRSIYRLMTDALGALRTDWTAFWVLGALSFAYGVFHAAGPGHGKVVISSYVLANEAQAQRGMALSMISAMVQALVAITFVLVLAGVLGLTSMALGDASHWLAVFSYALVAALGLWLVVRQLLRLRRRRTGLETTARAHLGVDHHHNHHHHHHDHDHEHEHCHAITPERAAGSWREQLGVVLAVGLRPCSGALVVLVFALSQGLLAAGIAAALLMGLGTGLTVAALAALAVWGKGFAVRIGGGGAMAGRIAWGIELAGGVLVLGFGLILLAASL